MNPKRAQLLSDGYVILRQVVPPGQLDRLRSDIETVVARQRASDPEWDRTPQPRASIIDQVDAATIGAFEFLLHENTHGVSAEVLDCRWRRWPRTRPWSSAIPSSGRKIPRARDSIGGPIPATGTVTCGPIGTGRWED